MSIKVLSYFSGVLLLAIGLPNNLLLAGAAATSLVIIYRLLTGQL